MKPDIRAAAAEGLNLVAHETQREAVARVPWDEGTLSESLVVTPATREALVSQVSSDLPYAVRQHEELDWHHNRGEAKYLENAVNLLRPRLESIIGAAVARRLGK